MIEIIQAGQSGKTLSMIDMHRLRKIIFKDRMQWDIDLSEDELEIDNYDLPETVYILARDEQNRAVGVWRMLPSTCPSMIRDIWPQFLENFSFPICEDIWETSRFGVHSYALNNREYVYQSRKTTARLISALVEVCVLTGIKDIYTLYNPQVGRAVRYLGFIPEAVSAEKPVDGKPTIIGRFRTDLQLLRRIQKRSNVVCNFTIDDLPPILRDRITHKEKQPKKEVLSASA